MTVTPSSSRSIRHWIRADMLATFPVSQELNQRYASDPHPLHTRQKYEQKSGQNMTPNASKQGKFGSFGAFFFICLPCMRGLGFQKNPHWSATLNHSSRVQHDTPPTSEWTISGMECDRVMIHLLVRHAKCRSSSPNLEISLIFSSCYWDVLLAPKSLHTEKYLLGNYFV